jgi:methyl-accepting chemotaxis protein
MDEHRSHYRVWLPMRDSDGTVLGHVGMDFSKRFLLAKSRNNMLSSLMIALVILAATLGMGVIFAHSVVSDIRRAVAVMKDIAQGEGDLTRRLDISSKD